MRTRTSTERTRIGAPGVNHHIKFLVQNTSGTWKDLTDLGGVNWVDSIEWGESIDQPTGTATITLRRDTTSPGVLSLAPLMGGSSLNRDDSDAFSSLLWDGAAYQILTAVTDPGVAPVSGDWKLMQIGRIDNVKWDADPITLTCRDLGGWIVDAWIQQERAYATSGPVAIETIMGLILAADPVHGSPTITTPVSPSWDIDNSAKQATQSTGGMLEALQQDWALSIGWALGYRHDASDTYGLLFYDPDRSKTVSDDTFGPSEYQDITDLEVEDADVRNLIVGLYTDSAGVSHTLQRPTSDPVTSPTASQARYGVKYMQLVEAAGSPIDNDTLMGAELAAALSDLEEPFATQEVETLYYWPVQLYDLYTFEPNLDHYDDAQQLAVVSYSHKAENGQIVTTMQCRGNVVGAYHAWLRKSYLPTATPTTPDLSITPGTLTSTTSPFEIDALNPLPGGADPIITVVCHGCTMTIGGTDYADGVSTAITSGTTVVANRPLSTQVEQATLSIVAQILGGGSTSVSRTILNQLNVGPSLEVNPTPGDDSYSIDWDGIGVITDSIDGGSYGTPDPSPITVTRDSSDHTYTFKAVSDGQTVTMTIVVPALASGGGGGGISGIDSLTATDTFHTDPDHLLVDWDPSEFPSGTTFNISWDVNGGTSGSDTGISHPYNISTTFDGTLSGVLILQAFYGGTLIGQGTLFSFPLEILP